jgi:hypothetical protein
MSSINDSPNRHMRLSTTPCVHLDLEELPSVHSCDQHTTPATPTCERSLAVHRPMEAQEDRGSMESIMATNCSKYTKYAFGKKYMKLHKLQVHKLQIQGISHGHKLEVHSGYTGGAHSQ